jgi:LysR family cyn operon transcriptional activator
MELRQLRYFLKAGEWLNFTEAAKVIPISQSTLSQQIKQLEDELGVLLFERIGKRVALTEAGQHFMSYARRTVASAEDGRQSLKDLAAGQTGHLAIGVTYGLRSLLTPALIQFASAYPGVQVQVAFGSSDELITKLEQAQLDFVLTFQNKALATPFVSQWLFESSMVLVLSASCPLASQAHIRLADLSHLPLALPAQGYSTRQFLDQAFRDLGLKPFIQIEMNDIPTLLDIVRTGRWYTVLSMATVAGQADLKTVRLAEDSMNRQAWLVWPELTYRKKSATVFAELLTSPLDSKN